MDPQPGADRVALVHDWLTGMRGGEQVLEALAGIFPQAPIYTLFHFPGSVSEALEAHPVHTSFLQRAPQLRRHYRRYLMLFPLAIEDFDLSDYELVVSSSHCVAKGVIPPPGARHLCYCHTPMRYAWDQEHAYFPRRTGLLARVRGAMLSRLRSWDVSSSARVDTFVANSTFVARRIARYYRRQAEVIPPPVDTAFFEPGGEPASEKPFVLCVAALAPYKRLELAIRACEELDVELRIVGEGPDRSRLERMGANRTRLLGRIDRSELRQLYRDAVCFLQPGIEDFGIAAVEALACATPVVAAGSGGVLDIVGDREHGLLYPPSAGVEGLIGALRTVIDKSSGVRFNKLNLRARAESFSEARFATRVRELLGRVATPVGP